MPPRIFDLPALRLEVADGAWLSAENAGRLVLIKRNRALTATVILSPLSAPEVAAAGDLSGLTLDLSGDPGSEPGSEPAGRTLRAAGRAQAIRSLSLICRWIELRPDLDVPEAGARFYSAILREERHAHGVRADVMIAPAPGASGWEAQGSAQLREIQGLLKRATIKDAPEPAPARGRDPADGAGLAGLRLWSASSSSEGGSGYTREEIFSFYKDRTVLHQRLTTVSVSVPGLPAAGLGGGVRAHTARGRWVSDADSVTVRFEDGTIRTWALRLIPGGATLDGEFYRREPLG